MHLKGNQAKRLEAALRSAFRSYSDLERVVRFHLVDGPDDERLPDIASRQAPLREVVIALIDWAEAQGKLERLLAGARIENSGNPELKAFTLETSLTSDEAPQAQLEALVVQDPNFQNVGFQDVNSWRGRMALAERCVCRVETSAGRGIGSGFLVAPDVILTNLHVIDELQKVWAAPGEAAVRFDYMATVGGAAPDASTGSTVAFHANWEIATSPIKELDYALVRLNGRPGEEVLGDGRKRGCLSLQSRPAGWLKANGRLPETQDPLIILQHPNADPLKVAVGVVTDANNLFRRLAYNTNTAPGSSGSPCFTVGWELVALHHQGQSQGNHGVMIGPIAEDLRAKGLLAGLGAC